MIFFNEAGDEVGGLIYESERRDSAYRAFGHLSFDQWQQNQVVAVQYQDNGSSWSTRQAQSWNLAWSRVASMKRGLLRSHAASALAAEMRYNVDHAFTLRTSCASC